MILLIDNYDSFSYNLYQLIGSINPDIKVIRNDEMTVEEIEKLKPDAIILSPGPGKSSDAGICISVVKKLGGKIPILGVCLGHQAICEAYGAKVSYAKKLMHGKQSVVSVDNNCKIVSLVKQNTTTPCAVGFGISTPEQAAEMAKFSDGVIVGSAIVKIIAEYGENSVKYVSEYVKSMKDSIRNL